MHGLGFEIVFSLTVIDAYTHDYRHCIRTDFIDFINNTKDSNALARMTHINSSFSQLHIIILNPFDLAAVAMSVAGK